MNLCEGVEFGDGGAASEPLIVDSDGGILGDSVDGFVVFLLRVTEHDGEFLGVDAGIFEAGHDGDIGGVVLRCVVDIVYMIDMIDLWPAI